MFARISLFGLLAIALAAAPGAVRANQSPLDDLVVAQVNGQSITRAELVSRLLEYQGEEALQKMINRAIVLQGAAKHNVKVTDEEVEAKLDEIRKQFKSPADFDAFMDRSGLTPKQYRDEVRFTLLLERVAGMSDPITDEDLQQYDIRMIVAPDRATAEKWVSELEEGADFARMASQRSHDDSGRRAMGRMAPFCKIEMLDVWRIISEQDLKPGSFSKKPTLLADTTWVLIKLEAILAPSQVSGAERERLTTLIRRHRMDQWLIRARDAATIAFPVPIAAVVSPPASR
jgi:foldase protein PrsA